MLSKIGLAELTLAATRFRAALEAIDPAIWYAAATCHFPRGACGHSAELLGRYLQDTSGIEPEYILRDFYRADGEWQGGHAWIEWDGIILDVSGDQFWPPVIVSRDSACHSAGHPVLRQPLTRDAAWWGRHCAPLYAAALDWLERDAGPMGLPPRT